jgi:transposase-like protein
MKVSAVARRYEVTQQTVRRWIRLGWLEAMRPPATKCLLGGHFNVSPEAIERFERRMGKQQQEVCCG